MQWELHAAESGGRYVMEQSLVGCNASIRIVEKGIQSIIHQSEGSYESGGEQVASKSNDWSTALDRGCSAHTSLRGRARRAYGVREVQGT